MLYGSKYYESGLLVPVLFFHSTSLLLVILYGSKYYEHFFVDQHDALGKFNQRIYGYARSWCVGYVHPIHQDTVCLRF